jgi:hypothetical protein
MAEVSIHGETLVVELSLLDKIFSVHGTLKIPLEHVVTAKTTKPPSFWESLKIIGTNWPWGKMAGTYLFHGEVVFFDYGGREEAVLVVELADERYKHLFIRLDPPDTPEAAARRINDALTARGSTAEPGR